MPKLTKYHHLTPSQLLAEESSQPIFQLNVERGNMRYANDCFLELVGVHDQGMLVEAPLYSYIRTEQEKESLAEILGEMLKGGEGEFREISVQIIPQTEGFPKSATLMCWLTSENSEEFWQFLVKPMPLDSDWASAYAISSSKQNIKNTLNQIQRAISLRTGMQFFESLVKELRSHIQADYVYIGRMKGDDTEIQTLVMASDQGLEQNISYKLSDSPCQQTIKQSGTYTYDSGIDKEEPSYQLLESLNIMSYAGVALQHQDGRIIGVLGALYRTSSLPKKVFVRSIMELLASSIVSELDYISPSIFLGAAASRQVHAVKGNTTPTIVYKCKADEHRRVTFVNQEIAPMLGYTPDEILDAGEGWNDLVHPDDASKLKLHLSRAYQEHEYYFFEYRLQHKDGGDIWVYDSGRFIQEQNGEWALEGILQDITSHKLTEDALSAAESRYRSLVSAVSEGIMLHSASGEVVACNQAAQDMLGLSYEQIMGKTAYDDDWKAISEGGELLSAENYPAMQTLTTGVALYQFIMGVEVKGGELVWMSVNTEVIRNEDREISGVISSFLDITEVHQTKRQLEYSESRFKMLFESIPYAIVIVNDEGNIVMANPSMEDCFGYSPKELVGKPVNMLVPASLQSKHAYLQRSFFGVESVRKHVVGDGIREVMGVKADGETIPVEIVLSSLSIDHNSYALCMVRDVSRDKKHLELEKAHKKVTDSLRYAQRIQMAQLGNYQEILGAFKDGVIFFSPKDIVSGDFYWYSHVQQLKFDEKTLESETLALKILVAADCTGHGVPGAFMAALGNAFLHEIVNEHHIIEPHRILSVLDQKIISTLQKRGGVQTEDGMDVSILVLNEQTREISFAGAKNPLYIVRDDTIEVIKGSPYSLGGRVDKRYKKKFKKHIIQAHPNDRFYLSSDGFQDQFGGPEGRKYLTKNFRKLLFDLRKTPMNEQNEAFADTLMSWKGVKKSQTDDILILGIEI